jgi:hypothetical protein
MLTPRREQLSDQKALADEIGNAIANGPTAGEPIDEGELDEELSRLEQEDLDEKMLKTGTVPVLPAGANGESKRPCPRPWISAYARAQANQAAQSRGKRRMSRRRTRRRSCGSCKRRWQCKGGGEGCAANVISCTCTFVMA